MDTDLRIKEIRQKDENNNFQSFPIGVNGQYVDLLSNLNLEEELKIGGNHYVTIDEDDNQLIILEYYSNLPHSDALNWENSITHTVRTTMDKGALILVDNIYDTNYFVVGPNENENNFLIIDAEESSSTTITMQLFEGQISNDKLLHTKTIVISSSVSNNGYTNYIINEEERSN